MKARNIIVYSHGIIFVLIILAMVIQELSR